MRRVVCAVILCACGGGGEQAPPPKPTRAAGEEVRTVFDTIASSEAQNLLETGAYSDLHSLDLGATTFACTYAITPGNGTTGAMPTGFAFTPPSAPWYYAIATCGTTSYFTSSVDPTIRTTR